MKKQLIAGALLLAVLAVPTIAFAQVNVNYVSPTTFNLKSADLEATVIKIVQWVLTLLGLIAVIMILYGGFTWLTAGGNEEKVASAKKIISAAIIGLIIVLLAWAIVTFVVKAATNVTT